MIEKLFNETEAAHYLGISEQRLKDLVQKKKLPAYNIGGQFLRFNQKDLDDLKKSHSIHSLKSHKKYSLFNRFKDYFYYNDFYIIAAILIIILLVILLKVSF